MGTDSIEASIDCKATSTSMASSAKLGGVRGERLARLDEGECWSVGIGLETTELVAEDSMDNGDSGATAEW